MLADTLTPVNIYLKLRDVFATSILLESSDYHGHDNSRSIICCEPLASITVRQEQARCVYPDGHTEQHLVPAKGEALNVLQAFSSRFQPASSLQLPACGLFGYMAYDAVRFFEDITLDKHEDALPDLLYTLYRYVIVVDHFHNELTLLENTIHPEEPATLDRVQQLITANRFSTYAFHLTQPETSNLTDEGYRELVKKGIAHCQRGDVFQIVLSRRFTAGFQGDEFNVYRALRSINPSPYLFYFDYGNFKLFGSSPEAQLQVQGGRGAIFPIAGTFRRTGNDQDDAALAATLAADEKENAEHIMLVDLARNDMSRHAENVTVEVFKEIQYYSHVIHLVSKVSGDLKSNASVLDIAADTFPAGTLSGAPKHQAMKLINAYENVNRGFYGGAIGYVGFDGVFNHAIMIRTFMSKANKLTYQAGAGVVSKSDPQRELQEVNNKIDALRKAITLAETL